MDIKEQLLLTHSKANNLIICNWIGDDIGRFAELMKIFLGNERVLVQRAAWSVSELGIKYPHLIPPYLDAMIAAVEAALHAAVQRNILKLLAEKQIQMNEDQQGRLLNTAFDLLADPLIPVAIRVHAMQFIANLCEDYPDLAVELKTLIEDGMENGTAGFKSRGSRILKRFCPGTT